tara:strand:+ start:317 stop:514 length:198 start_codon:yes stop_codon:yes gene_type:complete
MNKHEWMHTRSRTKYGLLRKKRSDAKIDGKIREKLDYNKNKTIGEALKDNNVISISQLRRKLKLS